MLAPLRIWVLVPAFSNAPAPEMMPANPRDTTGFVVRVWPEAIVTLVLALPPLSPPMVSDPVTRRAAAVFVPLLKTTGAKSRSAAPPCTSSVPAEIVVWAM
ncbi:hypothetical protein AFCDBAGC_1273 [Methylobacterium cerastii]|uniref:Secreted protein n=1 Tax=Methylobacterium cerastii TaxID=932741 RepID=A0ABQ4QE90_9HYPH|nr:hypothetical protein AFCDBAGC_1273 [Methylobacterium cerastii]